MSRRPWPRSRRLIRNAGESTMVEAGGVSSRALSIFFFCGLWLIGGVKREVKRAEK